MAHKREIAEVAEFMAIDEEDKIEEEETDDFGAVKLSTPASACDILLMWEIVHNAVLLRMISVKEGWEEEEGGCGFIRRSKNKRAHPRAIGRRLAPPRHRRRRGDVFWCAQTAQTPFLMCLCGGR